MKKISVIIPCYNVGAYIERCFASLEGQTIGIDQLELIFIDDGSTDDTYDKLLKIEKSYEEHVIVLHSDVNIKPGAARNLGLEYASADYVLFVDSDDWVDDNYCQLLYERAESEQLDMVICNVLRDFGNGKVIEVSKRARVREVASLEDEAIRKQFLVEDRLGDYCYAKLIRRQVLVDNDIYFPEGIVFEDIAWGKLCYGYFRQIGFEPDTYYHYFVNESSIVLKKGQDYYEDMLISNEYKWESIVNRNLLEDMRLEWEFDFLVTYFLGVIKMFTLHYDHIPLEVFERMQAYIAAHISSISDNKYVKEYLSKGQQDLLFFADKTIKEDELKQLYKIIKSIGV